MIKPSTTKGTLLRIKFFDNEEEKPFRGSKNLEQTLRSFKAFLKKCATKWEYAIMYKDGNIYCYFHKSEDTNELNKEQYIKCLRETQINLYVVYTLDYKRRVGSDKAKTILNSSIEDVKSLYNQDVEKILVYQNGKITATYKDGRFI